MRRRRVLVFFSDTGGGHRAAANALRDAFHAAFPGRYDIVFVDGFKSCAPFPFNHIPSTWLPMTTHTPWLWGAIFRWTNSRLLMPLAARFDDFVMRPGCARAIRKHDPDLVISDHPLINRAPCNALRAVKPRARFVTVVTDLFDAHGLWFSADSDLLVVPTRGAFERGVRWKFPADRMRVVGQPIGLTFAAPAEPESTEELRGRLGLRGDIVTVLLVGGGEGMGRIRDIARALDASGLAIQLVMIAGRNDALRARLQADRWHVPVSVQGFVENMPDWLRASDVVITKAGPSTIMEALAAGKPLILSGYIPGQETGNVTFVEKMNAGVLRETPRGIVDQLRTWLELDPTALQRMKDNALRAARPRAAFDVVELVDQLIDQA